MQLNHSRQMTLFLYPHIHRNRLCINEAVDENYFKKSHSRKIMWMKRKWGKMPPFWNKLLYSLLWGVREMKKRKIYIVKNIIASSSKVYRKCFPFLIIFFSSLSPHTHIHTHKQQRQRQQRRGWWSERFYTIPLYFT
jgi:hypothetical protein